MKRITITICAAAFLISCNNEDKTKAEAKTEKDTTMVAAASTTSKPEAIPDSVMMKNWQAYMTPGKEHQLMASWSGTWDAETTIWMKPDQPPTKSTGTAVNKMILNGLYQQSIHKGSFNGMPFEGMSTLGFDNAKKVFVSTWVDNMGSGIMKMEGSWDETTKSATFNGQCVDPGTNKEMTIRETFKMLDKDRQLMEMFGPGPDGKEFKTMSILFTRRK
jgi:hypothetical protein